MAFSSFARLAMCRVVICVGVEGGCFRTSEGACEAKHLDPMDAQAVEAMQVQLLQRGHRIVEMAHEMPRHAAGSSISETSSAIHAKRNLSNMELKTMSAKTGEQRYIQEIQDTTADRGGVALNSVSKFTRAVSMKRMQANLEWKLNSLSCKPDPGSPACGNVARVSLITSPGVNDEFHAHGVYGGAMKWDRDGLDGLSVYDVENMFTEGVGDMSTYSPWMDHHFAFYDNDINRYAKLFTGAGTKFLAVEWKTLVAEHERYFYSLIVHVAETQEIYEVVSAMKPDGIASFHEHPLARHVFTPTEYEYLVTESVGIVPLNVAHTARNLSAVKSFYKDMFDLEPLAEAFDEANDEGYLFFSHNSSQIPVARHIQFWYRGNQKPTGTARTTHYLEERLEAINAKLSETCWPMWGDNHYALKNPPKGLVRRLWDKYDAVGQGYKIFSQEDDATMHMSTYFPLPGGFYIEVHDQLEPMGQRRAEKWDANYCYAFSCGASRA